MRLEIRSGKGGGKKRSKIYIRLRKPDLFSALPAEECYNCRATARQVPPLIASIPAAVSRLVAMPLLLPERQQVIMGASISLSLSSDWSSVCSGILRLPATWPFLYSAGVRTSIIVPRARSSADSALAEPPNRVLRKLSIGYLRIVNNLVGSSSNRKTSARESLESGGLAITHQTSLLITSPCTCGRALT